MHHTTPLFGHVALLTSLGLRIVQRSLGEEKIHRKLLFERMLENPTLTKYTFGTRARLQWHSSGSLDELLPNDTKVWWQWKAAIPEQLHRGLDGFTRQEIRGTTSISDSIRCDCSYVAADAANSRRLFAGGIY